MAKQVVVLVHGMGTHPKNNMRDTFKQALTDRAESFGLTDTGFMKDVDYVEYNYSDYFDAIRQQFAQNAEARQKGFKYLTGMGFGEKLLRQLTDFEASFGKDEFLYTHWLDVILYATMYFGEVIRLDFIEQFDKLRKKYEHMNIHVVCHSLGAALVHDALAKYYRHNANFVDNIKDVKTGDFNIASLWTFANVSRLVNLLNGLEDPYQSTVVTGNAGCTESFFNIRHKYDPFTWFKTYDRAMQNKKTFTLTTIRKKNTHDFYEYVTEPKVARKILSIIYDQVITDDQFNAGSKAYRKGALKEEVKSLKDSIDAVRDDVSIDTVKKAIAQFKVIQDKIA